MKLLLWQQNPVFGACETYLAELARGIASRRPAWALTLAAPAETLDEWGRRVPAGVALVPAPTTLGAAYAFLRRARPDLLHVNDPALLPLAAGRLARIRQVVVTWHTPSLAIERNRGARLLARAGSGNPRLSIITLSETNRRTLAGRGQGRAPIVVVEPGLPSEPWDAMPDQATAREAARIPPDRLQVVSVGRLCDQKAFHVLIRAVALADARLRQSPAGPYRSVGLSLVGDGERRPELEALVRELDAGAAVSFLGWQEDVRPALAAADLFAMSSVFEGLPFALLEAMAAGLPVVAGAVDGIRDAVTPETGRLVPPGDPIALAEAIVDLASGGELATMGKAAREAFLGRFGADRMVRDTLLHYSSVTGAQ